MINDRTKGLSEIVKTVTKWVKGFIFLFGIYIICYGHLTPGGGFAGGVLIAGSYILLTLAFGKEVALDCLPEKQAHTLDSIGAILFLIIGLSAFAFGTMFLSNYINDYYPGQPFRLLSSGIIPLCNLAIGLKVGTSLFAVFFSIAEIRVVKEKDKRVLLKRGRE